MKTIIFVVNYLLQYFIRYINNLKINLFDRYYTITFHNRGGYLPTSFKNYFNIFLNRFCSESFITFCNG